MGCWNCAVMPLGLRNGQVGRVAGHDGRVGLRCRYGRQRQVPRVGEAHRPGGDRNPLICAGRQRHRGRGEAGHQCRRPGQRQVVGVRHRAGVVHSHLEGAAGGTGTGGQEQRDLDPVGQHGERAVSRRRRCIVFGCGRHAKRVAARCDSRPDRQRQRVVAEVARAGRHVYVVLTEAIRDPVRQTVRLQGESLVRAAGVGQLDDILGGRPLPHAGLGRRERRHDPIGVRVGLRDRLPGDGQVPLDRARCAVGIVGVRGRDGERVIAQRRARGRT